MAVIVRFGPIVVLATLWWLLTSVFRVPGKILAPTIGVMILFAVVYLGGRLYKPYRYDKKTRRCIARSAADRRSCRHYMPGARLGGGCGRLREDRGCRYVR
jgi:hypothetical protein